MAEYKPMSDSVFTLSESVRKEILEHAKSGYPDFSVAISLGAGKMTAWCYQGDHARERAEAAWETVSDKVEYLSDVKTIAPGIFAFIG